MLVVDSSAKRTGGFLVLGPRTGVEEFSGLVAISFAAGCESGL
jgi:hypothetical protein